MGEQQVRLYSSRGGRSKGAPAEAKADAGAALREAEPSALPSWPYNLLRAVIPSHTRTCSTSVRTLPSSTPLMNAETASARSLAPPAAARPRGGASVPSSSEGAGMGA